MHVMTPQLIEKHLVSVRDRVVELERELRVPPPRATARSW